LKPFQGLRVVEFATVGGVPFCAWMLAQHGAQVVRICSPRPRELGVPVSDAGDIGGWEREDITLDLKSALGRERALALLDEADVLIEGFRPGVMERLGLGPKECHERNPGLVYARLVGWNRNGPWAQAAGHDINYIAMAGALHAVGSDTVPLNLVGDIGGGALYLAFGIAAALQARAASGRGCVVDTAMTDGAVHLLSAVYGRLGVGIWNDTPASNVIDGGVPWYRTYETADGRHMAVGAIEERFYLNLLRVLGLDPAQLPARSERGQWNSLAAVFAARFREADMDEWARRFDGAEACTTPVLTLTDARRHDITRAAFEQRQDVLLPQAVPSFYPA
jgi:alpha-methylacyl-CoA racemase